MPTPSNRPDVVFRRPGDDDFDRLADFDGRTFGNDWTAESRERARPAIPLDRFWIGETTNRRGRTEIVAACGAYDLELTLPGGATVPTTAVTWVAVAVTHRRQGLLRQMMDRLREDAETRNEPLLILTSSEGGIYERFGYGVATRHRAIALDRQRTQIRPEFVPDPGQISLETRPGLEHELAERWDRYRRANPGELSRTPAWFNSYFAPSPTMTVALHDDGYAIWTITQDWNRGRPAHPIQLRDFCAITPEAHAAVWHPLLSIDLAGVISGLNVVSIDDPLPHLLTDPRQLRTTILNDFLWVAVRDATTVFGARHYRTDDQLVIGLDHGTLTEAGNLAVSGTGAEPTDAPADLICTPSALGPLLLGGVSASELAQARRLRADADVRLRADAFFGWNPIPHCRTSF